MCPLFARGKRQDHVVVAEVREELGARVELVGVPAGVRRHAELREPLRAEEVVVLPAGPRHGARELRLPVHPEDERLAGGDGPRQRNRDERAVVRVAVVGGDVPEAGRQVRAVVEGDPVDLRPAPARRVVRRERPVRAPAAAGLLDEPRRAVVAPRVEVQVEREVGEGVPRAVREPDGLLARDDVLVVHGRLDRVRGDRRDARPRVEARRRRRARRVRPAARRGGESRRGMLAGPSGSPPPRIRAVVEDENPRGARGRAARRDLEARASLLRRGPPGDRRRRIRPAHERADRARGGAPGPRDARLSDAARRRAPRLEPSEREARDPAPLARERLFAGGAEGLGRPRRGPPRADAGLRLRAEDRRPVRVARLRGRPPRRAPRRAGTGRRGRTSPRTSGRFMPCRWN